jgi:hypothetical protein
MGLTWDLLNVSSFAQQLHNCYARDIFDCKFGYPLPKNKGMSLPQSLQKCSNKSPLHNYISLPQLALKRRERHKQK